MNDLFQNINGIEVPASRKLRRNSNPETSDKSAQTVIEFGYGHQRKIYETLCGMTDGTFYEIAEKSGLEPASVWRRLNEIEKTGHIETTGEERKGPTGRLCRVWKVK